MKISYAITVCTEHEELKRLLNILYLYKREEDEIVIQGDQRKVTESVLKVIGGYVKMGIQYCEYPLNNHYADFKNNLTKQCSGDWIFQIDADEYPHQNLIESLPRLLEENSDLDLILVPRANTVEGITDEYIGKWSWRVVDYEGMKLINPWDFQWRIFKNNGKIKWKNKVHEVLEGYDKFATLPELLEWCLFHPKTIEKQIKQNEYYQTLF